MEPEDPGLEDNTARLVSGSNGKVLGTLVAHTETLECVGLSGDFPFGASGAIDNKLVVWDLNTLQPRNTLPHDKAAGSFVHTCRSFTRVVRSFVRST